jgi:hypothetical protein
VLAFLGATMLAVLRQKLFTSLLSTSILKLALLHHSSPAATSPDRLSYKLQLHHLIKKAALSSTF